MPVSIVSFTSLMDKAFDGLYTYCADNYLDPKKPKSLLAFWKSRSVDYAVFVHMGITCSGDNSLAAICQAYGLLTARNSDQIYVYGNMASWGLFFRNQKKHFLTEELLPILKGKQLHDFLS